MTADTSVATREKVRVFVTGSCDGLPELREALERHGELDIVGWSSRSSFTGRAAPICRTTSWQPSASTRVLR
jgi:hypothetical protein